MDRVTTVHVAGPKLLAASLCSVLNTFPGIAAYEAVPRISVKDAAAVGESPVLLVVLPSLPEPGSHSETGSQRIRIVLPMPQRALLSGPFHPSCVVLVLRGTPQEFAAAFALGFHNCVGIEDEPGTLVQAVQAAARSEAYSSATVAAKPGSPPERRTRSQYDDAQGIPREALTKRERNVSTLAAAGFSNAEISTQLSISLDTVKSHLKEAYKKLGIQRRGQIRM